MGYPSMNRNIFVSANNKENESTISSKFFRSKYYEYEIAYKKAAEAVIEKAIENRSLFLCVSTYPIMFLYRQFLELYIKDILFQYDGEFNGKIEPYNKHDIYKLWKRLLQIVKENIVFFPQQVEDTDFMDILCATDGYMEEIAIYDQNSMAFRYPDDKTHTQPFFPNEIPVDLINIKERLNELADMLFLIENVFCEIKTMEESIE